MESFQIRKKNGTDIAFWASLGCSKVQHKYAAKRRRIRQKSTENSKFVVILVLGVPGVILLKFGYVK